jgi:hypothetical protein
MTRKNLSLLLLAALGVAVWMPVPALAGGTSDDLFGDDLIRTQQGPVFDDAQFAQVMDQELTYNQDVSKHPEPVRRRLVTHPSMYRVFDSYFDVYWDTVSFRSKESQGEGAALVTVMFKDAAYFDYRLRRSVFSFERFLGTALNRCQQGGLVIQPMYQQQQGLNEGFTGFDSGGTVQEEQFRYDKSVTSSYKAADKNFDIDLGVDGGKGKSDGFVSPVVIDGDDSFLVGDKYRIGGYRGLYDFSKNNTRLVKNFLVRAAQDSRYERIFQNTLRGGNTASVYGKIKSIITAQRLPVLTLLPKQRDAVLIYCVIERSDGTGAMLYWRPSDRPGTRVSRDLNAKNIIWAVPQRNGGYQFYDRAELSERRFRWGAPAEVLIVPNLCSVYRYFAGYVNYNLDGPSPIPSPYPGKTEPYPPSYDNSWPPPYVPDCGFPDSGRRDDGSGFNIALDFLFNGGSSFGFSYGQQQRYPNPPIQLQPPIWTPMPTPRPPTGGWYPPNDPFIYRPTPKNPYCNKPIGTGRGNFVRIGFNYDESGYNQYGFNSAGLNQQGFDPWGYNAQGYGADGFNPWGYDRGGFNRSGYPLSNRSRDLISLINQYHQNTFAFRMQFDIKEDGSIVRIVDGVTVWNNGGSATNPGTVPVPTVPAPIPVVPGENLTKDLTPEYQAATIKGKITGIAAPYEVQLDKAGRYHIFKDNVRTAVPRNINVNLDFQMQFQDKSKDYIFIQSTPATR